jgi:hypothetical protein
MHGKVLPFGARERVRGAGAALIDDNDVALALDAGECTRHRRVERPRCGAGSPGEHEERIRLLAAADGGDTRDAQPDLPAVGPLRVLGHLQHPTFGGQHGKAQGMLDLARCEHERGSGERAVHGGSREEDAKRDGPTRGRHSLVALLKPGPSADQG